ncbi:MAG: radical SAM/SPASM domain-containing protein [Parachlamydiales bacterium]|jgi:2-deoxy-scyllo-inosamine dehydrogenase (SAM-dependent)
MTKFIAPFKMVEIEINSHCNRQCPYCPQGIPEYRKPPVFMNVENFQHIMNSLKKAEFSGRLSFHFFNEPLLHPNLDEMIICAKEILPNAHQVIFTNGDLLTDETFNKLIALGVSKIVITSHSGKIYPQREGQIVLKPIDLNLTNRGGKVLKKTSTLSIPCFAPSTMLIIGVNGDIILCYEDADKTLILGNIFNNSVEEIWNSPLAVNVRNELEKGNRNNQQVCCKCDNTTHIDPIVYDIHP